MIAQPVNDAFQFKSFSVRHDRCAMKVGTDAILLGSWASAVDPANILDIGTGCGVIALMLAQRFPKAQVHAVELDEQAANQASENFRDSPWTDRLSIIASPVQAFSSDDKFDLITSNPPYFNDGLKPPDANRAAARHDDNLPTHELMEAVARLLNDSGHFSAIVPCERAEEFEAAATYQNLVCRRRCLVLPTPTAPPKRVMLEFRRTDSNHVCDVASEESTLVVELERHRYSQEYAALAKDFLLKL